MGFNTEALGAWGEPVEFKVEGFIRSRWFQAFACHDQRQPRPTRKGAAQKCNECAMR